MKYFRLFFFLSYLGGSLTAAKLIFHVWTASDLLPEMGFVTVARTSKVISPLKPGAGIIDQLSRPVESKIFQVERTSSYSAGCTWNCSSNFSIDTLSKNSGLSIVIFAPTRGSEVSSTLEK